MRVTKDRQQTMAQGVFKVCMRLHTVSTTVAQGAFKVCSKKLHTVSKWWRPLCIGLANGVQQNGAYMVCNKRVRTLVKYMVCNKLVRTLVRTWCAINWCVHWCVYGVQQTGAYTGAYMVCNKLVRTLVKYMVCEKLHKLSVFLYAHNKCRAMYSKTFSV